MEADELNSLLSERLEQALAEDDFPQLPDEPDSSLYCYDTMPLVSDGSWVAVAPRWALETPPENFLVLEELEQIFYQPSPPPTLQEEEEEDPPPPAPTIELAPVVEKDVRLRPEEPVRLGRPRPDQVERSMMELQLLACSHQATLAVIDTVASERRQEAEENFKIGQESINQQLQHSIGLRMMTVSTPTLLV